MVTPNRPVSNPPSSRAFFGLGIRVAGVGTVLIAVYFFLVVESPIPGLRESLSWVIPVGIFFWIVAVGLLTAGVAVREDGRPEEIPGAGAMAGRKREGSAEGWIATARVEMEKKFPSVFHPEWTFALLRSLDGERLVQLGAAYFRELGFRAVPNQEPTPEIDIWLYDEDESKPTGAVACLPWGDAIVGVRPVRKFHESLIAEGIGQGVMIATGAFSEEASIFASGKTLELLSGEEFLTKLAALPTETSQRLLLDLTRGGLCELPPRAPAPGAARGTGQDGIRRSSPA